MISSSSGGSSEEEERSCSQEEGRSTAPVAVGENVGAAEGGVGGDAAAAMSCLELDAWIRDDDGTIDCMMMLPEMPLEGDDDSTSPEEDSGMHQDRCEEFEHKDDMIFCRSSSSCSSTFPDSANQETLELNLPDDFFDRHQQHDEDHRHQQQQQQQQQRAEEILPALSEGRSFVPDLRKIIVKKPVMDKAVERLGGGRRGAMRLWNIIQVWLKHQGNGGSDGLSLPLENFGVSGAGFVEMPFQHNDQHFQHPVLPVSAGFGDITHASNGGGHFLGDGGQFFGEGNVDAAAAVINTTRSVPPCSSSAAAATTRAARKSRMARQRRQKGLAHTSPVSSAPWSSSPPSSAVFLATAATAATAAITATTITTTASGLSLPTAQASPGARDQHNFSSCRDGIKARIACEKNVKFLLQKELKPSDVGNLGRIVLPKKEAEIHLPYLSLRDGITLAMDDVLTAQTWHFRYRFWPNNKSRMYLLEGTGEFVKTHLLKEGDVIQIYRDAKTGKHIIFAKKMAKAKSVKSADRTSITSAPYKQADDDCLSGASTVSDSSVDQQKQQTGCKLSVRKRKAHTMKPVSEQATVDAFPMPNKGNSTSDAGGGGGVERFSSIEMEDEFIEEILGMVDGEEPSSPESCKEDD